jgi:perosamine synthetase
MTRIGELERRYVLEVLDGQFRSSSGSRMTARLEQKFRERFGRRHAIAFNNGTATLHAALAAAGVGPGDEVIVPPLTMASTSFAVLHAGAVPVFADVDPRTWIIDPESVEQRVSARTKAVIPVSIYGLAPDYDGLLAVARRHNLFVLEDDAQCFLGRYRGRLVGSIGDAASFSFQSSKHMTSGEGGVILTDDDALAERVRRFNSLGYAGVRAGVAKISKSDIQDPLYERHVSVGFNYRMPELCAAVALAQLERLEELVESRRRAAALFGEAIADCSWLRPQAVPPGSVHSYWTYAVLLDNGGAFAWREFRDQFRVRGGDGIYAAWKLTYLEPAFRQNYAPGLCPRAEKIQPWLFQFKTNYWNEEDAARQAGILRATIAHFEGRHARVQSA